MRDEDFPPNSWGVGLLAVLSAAELDRISRGRPIVDRRILPYFSTILINSSNGLIGKEPSEPPFREIELTNSIEKLNLLRVIQRAFGEPEYQTINELAHARATDTMRLASDLRNYRKLTPEQIKRDINSLLEISRAIQVEESKRLDVRYAA